MKTEVAVIAAYSYFAKDSSRASSVGLLVLARQGCFTAHQSSLTGDALFPGLAEVLNWKLD